MTVEQAVRAYLMTAPAVVAIASTRGYVRKYPQAPTYPAFRITLAAEQNVAHMRGAVDQKPALVQVDSAAQEGSGTDAYDQASRLAQAIDEALMGQSPIRISDGASPATVLELKVVERPTRFASYDPDELRVVTMVQEFRIWSKVVA